MLLDPSPYNPADSWLRQLARGLLLALLTAGFALGLLMAAAHSAEDDILDRCQGPDGMSRESRNERARCASRLIWGEHGGWLGAAIGLLAFIVTCHSIGRALRRHHDERNQRAAQGRSNPMSSTGAE